MLTAAPAGPRRAGRDVIVVLGPHRSGTSALTRVLNLLGAGTGSALMPAREGNNPTGFWELEGVAAINDAAFHRLGLAWHSVAPMPAPETCETAFSEFRSDAAELLGHEFCGGGPFVLKDPRLCRLLPLWTPVFAGLDLEPSYVIAVRHPGEAARSLQARDDLPLDHGVLLWLRHLLEAEHASRSARRCFVSYERLLGDWRSVAGEIRDQLGAGELKPASGAESALDAFVDARLRHFDASDEQAADYPEIVIKLWAVLNDAARAGESVTFRAAVDALAGEFSRAARLLLPWSRELQDRGAGLERTLAAARADREGVHQALVSAQDELRLARSGLQELESRHAAGQARIDDLENALERAHATCVAARSWVEGIRESHGRSSEELASLVDAFHGAGQALDTGLETLEHLSALLIAQRRTSSSLRATRDVLADEAGELHNRVRHLQAQLDEIRSMMLVGPLVARRLRR